MLGQQSTRAGRLLALLYLERPGNWYHPPSTAVAAAVIATFYHQVSPLESEEG